jgi:DNA-binding transcriptional LysR family regulator
MGSRHVVYLSDFHAKKGALLSGAGYGWMPRHMIERELADGVLLTLATELHRWAYRPVLVTPSGRTLGPAGTLFAQTLMDSLPTGGAPPHHPLRQHQNF